jgi:apolipoprotein N-acyltransferase
MFFYFTLKTKGNKVLKTKHFFIYFFCVFLICLIFPANTPHHFRWIDFLPLSLFYFGHTIQSASKSLIRISIGYTILFLLTLWLKVSALWLPMVLGPALLLCLCIGIFIKQSFLSLRNKNIFYAFGISTVSWFLIALAYPPLPLGPLVFILLVPWIHQISRFSSRDAFIISFWSAIPFNAMMYYWIYHVMKVGPPIAIGAGLFLLISYLSLFNGILGFIGQKLSKSKLIWLLPLAWGGIEVLRSKGEISFPWGHLAYTLGDQIVLIQLSSIVGVFGLSAIIVWINISIWKLWQTRQASFLIIPGLLLILI